MGDKRDFRSTEYLAWSKNITRYVKVFIAGVCLLFITFAVGIKILDKTSVVFWASLIAIVIWCFCGYFILQRMTKKKASLQAEAHKVERPEITNPLFKELFDEYEFDQLEGFTQNVFFHTWRLRCVDDYNNVISLCFSKKQHEIAIDLSEDEISIIIDEETDAPIERVMKMRDFNSLDEVFNTITAVCRDSIAKKK